MADALPPSGRQRRAVLAWAAVLVSSPFVPTLRAQDTAQPSVSLDWDGLRLQREGDALLLSAAFHWSLPELVQDALLQGIPVHFVAEAQMLRERWYWSDQELLHAQRYLRLSYQPLTRRWRLHVGNQPFEGQGLKHALFRSFDSLDEAMYAMQRTVRWRIGSISALPTSGEALLQVRFRIDLSHFPRPLQIGALGRSDWNMLVTRQEHLDLEALQ